MVYPLADSTNRAQCKAATLIKTHYHYATLPLFALFIYRKH